MMEHIHISDVEGKNSICFDTGLDPRSFARTKMSNSLIEPGYVVYPDGSNNVWKAGGVNEVDGFMRVWGPLFTGERLDIIINKADSHRLDTADRQKAQQAALQAIVFWIRAKLLFSATHSALSPGAAFITCNDGNTKFPKGSVFFGPENLSQRCLFVEKAEPNYYYCPDLYGMEAAAFCAGAMLYKLLADTHPYSDTTSVYQDMREGIFLPPNIAAPGLDEKLSNLILSALSLPVARKRDGKSGTDILGDLLNMLMDSEGEIIRISSLFNPVTSVKQNRIEKVEKQFRTKKNTIIKSRRFIARNKHGVALGVTAAVIIAFLAISMMGIRSSRPVTAGLFPDSVVITYYEAFNSMNHTLMEACIMGADKTDIDVVVNLFLVDRMRQSFEMAGYPSIASARVWQEMGNKLPAPNVFGITNFKIENLGGSESAGLVVYRVDYIVWYPHEPIYSIRSDEVTVRLDRRKNWRISEILRTERMEMSVN